jgi:hypothetical protein
MSIDEKLVDEKRQHMFLLSRPIASTSPSACAPGAASFRVAAFAPRYASPDGVRARR